MGEILATLLTTIAGFLVPGKSRPDLLRRVSAIDHEVRARDERGVVRGKEQDGVSDLPGLGTALDQLGSGPLRMDVRGRPVEAHRLGLNCNDPSPHDAGTHGVDADVVGSQVHGHAAGHTQNLSLIHI